MAHAAPPLRSKPGGFRHNGATSRSVTQLELPGPVQAQDRPREIASRAVALAIALAAGAHAGIIDARGRRPRGFRGAAPDERADRGGDGDRDDGLSLAE